MFKAGSTKSTRSESKQGANDVPDTDPQEVVAHEEITHDKSITEETEFQKRRGKRKRRHSGRENDDDDVDEFCLPATKKSKFSIVKPFKKLLNEIGKYVQAFEKDVTDGVQKVKDLYVKITPSPTSREILQKCEQDILKETDGRFEDVEVEEDDGNKVIIHTAFYEATSGSKFSKTALVLLHGYGSGVACFYKNFQHLHQKRNVYAIDLPGFALSSRVEFPDDPQGCRQRMVGLIEKWRVVMKLDKFILLGHSFGGYIAGSYAVQHKEHVRHLIVAEGWGVLSKNEDKEDINLLLKVVMELELTPYSIMAKHNNTGRSLYNIIFPKKIKELYGEKMTQYFYHCNAQLQATGEKAFRILSNIYRWPHLPLRKSLESLDSSIPITFLYGKESRFNNGGGEMIKSKRKNVFLPDVLKGSHHIQIQDLEGFNKSVNDIGEKVDNNTDLQE